MHEDTAADHAAYQPPRVDDTISEDDDLAPPPSRDLAPGTPCGDYEIETKIGEGAWGAVYRAVHPTIGKHVAIKVMSHKLFDEPEAHKRFVAEARALASIRHPGIVEIFGIGRLRDGRAFLTMQWLEGETLGARMQRGALPRDQALEIVRQIARALDAAHVKNIVHRDLKPENVFLLTIDDELSVKLVDFGLAKATKDTAVGVTRSGQMVGTPLYMSPEQCRSKGVDHRTDIYALGCLGYEMLCGRVPFVHDNAAELISAHLNNEPPSPRALRPDLAPQLDRMLVRMIAKRPDDRPTLGDVRQTIGSVLRRSSQPMQAISATVDLESATTADDHTGATKPSLRRWMVIAIAAIVVVALGIFAFSSLSQARRQPPAATAPP
jgi:serine/threonine-protein kinase